MQSINQNSISLEKKTRVREMTQNAQMSRK